jgi:hypothetical protein
MTPYRPQPVAPEQRATALNASRLVVNDGVMTSAGSRSILAAIPLLRQADRVSIFSSPQYESEGADPADLAESLQGMEFELS